MRNSLTGILTFIVYTSLCLLLYTYLFTDSFNSSDSVQKKSKKIVETPVVEIKESSISPEISTTQTPIDLNKSIDTITINTPIVESTQDSTIDSTIIETITTPEHIKEAEIYTAKPFVIKDTSGNPLTQCKSFSSIYKGYSKVKIPYPCRNYGYELKVILDNHQKTQVLITAYYSDEESTDLGMQRANYIKKLLVNTGIDENRINTKEALKNISFSPKGIAQGGVDIQVLNTMDVK